MLLVGTACHDGSHGDVALLREEEGPHLGYSPQAHEHVSRDGRVSDGEHNDDHAEDLGPAMLLLQLPQMP